MGSSREDRRFMVAAVRLAVVSEVKAEIAKGMSLSQAIKFVAGRTHLGSNGKLIPLSSRTIYRWVKAFEKDHLNGLCTQAREFTKPSHVLSTNFIEFLKKSKEDDPEASVPELIRRAKCSNIIGEADKISRVTVYRTCRKLNLPLMRKSSVKYSDMRRFSYEHRMQMVLCDGKHFRAGGSRKKRVALFFIDDATRFVPHVVVGTSESAELFLRGFYELITKVGLMTALYFDHGSGFTAGDVAVISSHLDVSLIHGEIRYPEGRGKIERFNQTVKADLLRSLDKNPSIDPACESLELRLQHYLNEMYNPREHESLNGSNPKQRFFSDSRELKFPESDQILRSYFVVTKDKKVSKDNVISEKNTFYEVPLGHARMWIKLHTRVLDGSLAVLHEGKLVDIYPVDLGANARSKRMGRKASKSDTSKPPAKTAAQMTFEKDFGPIVGVDGNFYKNQPNKE